MSAYCGGNSSSLGVRSCRARYSAACTTTTNQRQTVGSSRYPFVGRSRWFGDVVGKQIAAAAEGLPPEVVAAAQEWGQARDLWETARELLEELER